MGAVTSNNSGRSKPESIDAIFDSLASSDRRRILDFVLEQDPASVSRSELATALAGWSDGNPRAEVTDEERRQAEATLYHRYLPKLTDAGLLTRNADGTVALGDHPAFQDPGILAIINEDVASNPESIDMLFKALADPRRRRILDVLSHQFAPIHTETLAREIGAREQDVAESALSPEDPERIFIDLRHVQLPCLSDAELIEHDKDNQTVAYSGHPELRVSWVHSMLEPAFRQSLTGESKPEGIGEITGREQVISFGQSLCDQADEELFCMFTDTQLLEAGCLTRIRDASRRGADVYLGTRDPDIREYIHENAPEVVLWEPNTDWLNLPAAGDRVGRLLLADRGAVMLGTLLEKTTDGFHEEQAIVGEGEHNTLVTMICQLLGPHLEEIDRDTKDVTARLPL